MPAISIIVAGQLAPVIHWLPQKARINEGHHTCWTYPLALSIKAGLHSCKTSALFTKQPHLLPSISFSDHFKCLSNILFCKGDNKHTLMLEERCKKALK